MRADVPRENRCAEDCYPICDFCYYYDFNSNKGGGYMDLGYCRLHQEQKDPADDCDKFICSTIKQKEEIRRPKFEPKPEAKALLSHMNCELVPVDEALALPLSPSESRMKKVLEVVRLSREGFNEKSGTGYKKWEAEMKQALAELYALESGEK